MELLSQNIKEKVDMILEPFQVMVELSLLSHCNVGTKVSVSDNLLHIQQPHWTQGVVRWYQNDNKDDLYYLFHAVRRYYMWYKNKKDNKIFKEILRSAIKGIDKLIDTYKKSDRQSILHTLSLYKNLLELDNNELFKDEKKETVSMDQVFKNIVHIYNDNILRIVYNTLILLEKETNQDNKQQYIDGLRSILTPINNEIRNWIQENLSV
tara:strand:- start:415 stop:1041 length:627 start_codon:yes stop_codon:yes gene_type:complete